MLMQIDGTFVFVVISFLIFLYILKAILYNPITKVMDERKNFYTKNLRMENESKEKSNALLKEKEDKLKEAKIKANNIIKNTTEEANKESERKLKELNQEALKKTQENKEQLQQESNNVKNELKSQINDFTSLIASKILGEEIKIELDDNTIKQFLKI